MAINADISSTVLIALLIIAGIIILFVLGNVFGIVKMPFKWANSMKDYYTKLKDSNNKKELERIKAYEKKLEEALKTEPPKITWGKALEYADAIERAINNGVNPQDIKDSIYPIVKCQGDLLLIQKAWGYRAVTPTLTETVGNYIWKGVKTAAFGAIGLIVDALKAGVTPPEVIDFKGAFIGYIGPDRYSLLAKDMIKIGVIF